MKIHLGNQMKNTRVGALLEIKEREYLPHIPKRIKQKDSILLIMKEQKNQL